MKLTVELIPGGSWGANLRAELGKTNWNKVRRKAYKAAGYVCELCGGVGSRHPVECHEIWEYDDVRHTQTLVGFQALCTACHRVKHLGRTYAVGFGEQSLKHLIRVNESDMDTMGLYVEDVFAQWFARSLHEWEVDLRYVDTYLE